MKAPLFLFVAAILSMHVNAQTTRTASQSEIKTTVRPASTEAAKKESQPVHRAETKTANRTEIKTTIESGSTEAAKKESQPTPRGETKSASKTEIRKQENSVEKKQ